MGAYQFKDIIYITGITERIVKYWVQEYGLEFKKSGRNTVFPEETKNSLLLIKALSDTELYTQKFIKTVLECLKTGDTSKYDHILSEMKGFVENSRSVLQSEPKKPAPVGGKKAPQKAKPQASLEVDLL